MATSVRTQAAWGLILAVLAGLGYCLQPSTRPVQPPGVRACLFLSSNTDEGLTLAEAFQRLRSPAHRRSRALAVRILRDLGVAHAFAHDAVGDWSGGVENSLLVHLPVPPDPPTLRCAAAWFGLMATQKSVLAFQADEHGKDVLVTLDMPGSLANVRRTLDQHDIRDRTILVGPASRGGQDQHCRVVVLDVGGQQQSELTRLARAVGVRAQRQAGRAMCLAGATHSEARNRYREVLRDARVQELRWWVGR